MHNILAAALIILSAAIAPDEGVMLRLYEQYRETDPDKAMAYAGIYLSYSDSLAASDSIARLHDDLAEYYESSKFKYSLAIAQREQALRIYENLGDVRSAAISKFRIGRLNFEIGQYHKTLQYTTEALRAFRKLHEDEYVRDCYNLLGTVNYFCREYDEALSYFGRCATEAEAAGDSLRLLLALNNLAAYENNERSDTLRARMLIREAISLCRKTGDSARLFTMYMNLANSYLSTMQPLEARKVVEKLEPMATDIRRMGLLHFLAAGCDFYLGDYGAAIDEAKEAVRYFEQGEFPQKLKTTLAVMYESYSRLGMYKEAFEAMSYYVDLSETYDDDDIYYQVFKSQNEIIRQQLDSDHLRKRNRQIMAGTLFLLVFSGIMSAIYVKWRRKARRVMEQEAAVRAKKERLEITLTDKYQADKVIENVISRLNRLQIKDASLKKEIVSICSELTNTKDIDEWNEIRKFIPDFNSDSFARLIRDYPNLTVNERRLCAFLNKNMTTKDISMITKQSVHSITIARARLRSKFGLTKSSISIQEFLSKYN